MKKTLFLFLLLVLIGLFSVLEQSNEDSGQNIGSFTLWVPHKMIAGQDYEGMITLDRPSNQGNIFFLSTSDKSALYVPQSVNIPAFTNHGIFQIKPLKDGNATVFAALHGDLVESQTTVYTSNTQPSSLKLILPTNSTKAQGMISYVFSQDEFGLPAQVSSDTEIFVTTSSMIMAPQTITIPKGQYYTQLPLVTKGSGSISISADGLGVATADITRVHDDVKIRLTVAPDIALPNSLSYYYIWLEKDGKPFKPPYIIHASLTSSDTDVARFGSNYDVVHFNDILYSTPLKDGIAKGFIHTRDSGSTEISASVEGFGTASANLIVGPTTNNVPSTQNMTSFCNKFSPCKPNMIKMWSYPGIFDDKGYGIVGLYRDINTTSQNVLVPLEADSSTVQISSDGPDLVYAKRIGMIPTRVTGSNEETGVAQAIEFEIDAGGAGNYTITASGPGNTPSTASFSIVPRYDDSYNIKLTSLPAKTGIKQDLAILYLVDSSGAMVEPSNVFSQPPKVDIKTTIKDTPKSLQFSETNMVLSGTVQEKAGITTSISGLPSSVVNISPVDVATNVEFDLPQMVHVGEKFPYVAYKTDSFGVPIERIVPNDLSTTEGVNFDSSGKYMTIDREGKVTIAILSENGAIKQTVDSFYNEMHVTTDVNGTIFKVGRNNTFDIISDVANASYDIQSIFPVVRTSQGQFSITPTIEGSFDVTIFSHKDGFRPITLTLHLVSKKIIDISMSAVGNDGTVLHIMPALTVNNQSIISNTPFDQTTNAGQTHVEIPPHLSMGEKNYVLNHVDISGQRFTNDMIDTFLGEDSSILANYDLMLKINATDANGGGFYSYGSTVTLNTPEKWQASFLVRQVFDHWEGSNLPFDSKTNNVSFAAKDNVFATAIYRPDYTYLMLVIAGPITGIFAMKKRSTISWYAREINDTLEKFIPKLPVKKKSET
ncbi:MAG: hypothetical protein KGI09_08540 [Thaumarchaeota archaeon]|nr:hypothetical protein [Nitrososphaerota archaeon]